MRLLLLALWYASLHPCGFGRSPCCVMDDGCVETKQGWHYTLNAYNAGYLAEECL